MRDPIHISIAAPRETVFTLLVEPALQIQWMDGLAEAKYEGGGPARAGARFRHGIREGARIVVYEGEVRQCTPPIQFGYHIQHPQFAIEVDYLLTETDGGTRVDYRCVYRPKTRFARVIAALFSWMPVRLARKHLSRLKDLAESR